MAIRITKKEKLLSVSNEWCANDYYLIHGRIESDKPEDGFYRFKFVMHIDLACDLWNEETGEDIPYKEALDELIWACIPEYDLFNNEKQRSAFYRFCNDTIETWNGSPRAWYAAHN